MQTAVVGAGPGGARVAEALARRGHSVVLFDPSHPREKPCGGAIPPALFHKLPDLRELQPLGRPVAAVQLCSPAGALLRISLQEPIFVFSRRVLDGALLERACRAGALHRRERVEGIRVEPGGAWVRAEGGWERFDAVVGADGASSVVRRSILGQRPGQTAAWATGGFFVEGVEEEDLYVEFLRDMPGYLWFFPRLDHASAGIICPARRLSGRALRERVAAMLERRYPAILHRPRIRYGASIPIPSLRHAKRPPIGGPRFALVGDAAEQIDSITGEGIHHAVAAGDLLGRALHEAGPLEGPRLYAARWRRGAGRDLAVAARWTARYYGPRTVEFALAVARRSRRARRVMRDLLMVVQPYSRLYGRLLSESLSSPEERPSRGSSSLRMRLKQ